MSAKKRFYKEVTTSQTDDGFLVHLDGRNLRSPAGTMVTLPTAELATAIADEWTAQGDQIEPGTMPMFSLAVTVLDRVDTQRDDLVEEMAAYGGNDLLCYRAEDDDLQARQLDKWTPWLDWAKDNFDAPLAIGAGIMPVDQPAASVSALQAAVDSHDNWELGMLHRAVALGGSLILGLGFVRGQMDAQTLFETAFLDELWQVENWGSDWEAEDRRAAIVTDLNDASRFLNLKNGVAQPPLEPPVQSPPSEAG